MKLGELWGRKSNKKDHLAQVIKDHAPKGPKIQASPGTGKCRLPENRNSNQQCTKSNPTNLEKQVDVRCFGFGETEAGDIAKRLYPYLRVECHSSSPSPKSERKILKDKEVRGIVRDIENGKVKFGVIPFENPYLTHSLCYTLDTILSSSRTEIIGEVFLKIPAMYLGAYRTKDEIKKIWSTRQVNLLCDRYLDLDEQYTTTESEDVESFKKAGRRLAQDLTKKMAIIAPADILEAYNLKALEGGREVQHPTDLRFLILGQPTETEPTGEDRTFIAVQANEKKKLEYLRTCLTQFGLLKAGEGDYSFHYKIKGVYIYCTEIRGHRNDREISNAIKALNSKKIKGEKTINKMKVLGSFSIRNSIRLEYQTST